MAIRNEFEDQASSIGAADDQLSIIVAQNDTGDAPVGERAPDTTVPPTNLLLEVEDGSIVRLPEGASIDSPRVNGQNLEFVQPDGSVIVIPNGAIQGLTIFIGNVEIPPQTVAALFEVNNIQAAAGPEGAASGLGSGGGNFIIIQPNGIGSSLVFGDLLPPTSLPFSALIDETLLGNNSPPRFAFASYSGRVSEEGFDFSNADESGSDDESSSVFLTGNLGASDPNGDPLTFTFGEPTTPMTSNGIAITWTGMGTGTLTGSAGGTPVIMAVVGGTTGTYLVTLLQPVDHAIAGVEDEFALDLPITVSDGQGLSASTVLTVIIEDDSPLLGETPAGAVDEDGLAGPLSDGIGDSDGPEDNDGNDVSTGGALGIRWGADIGDKGTDTTNPGGSFVQDGALGAALTGRAVYFTDDSVAVIGGKNGTLTSRGDVITITLEDNGTRLVARAGGSEGYYEGDIYYGGESRVVFEATLSDEGTGAYEFRLFDQLDHASAGTEDDIALTFGFTARDADGDTATGTFKVVVDDDMPIARISRTGDSVRIDESGGNRNDNTSNENVMGRFSGLENFGSDPDMSGPIFARDDIVDTVVEPGADEKATRMLSLRIDDPASGLKTTEGESIYLYIEDGLVVGRVGGGEGVAAFALHIDNQGRVSIAQYMSLQHPDDGDPDDTVTLAGKISAVVTVTDQDGDVATDSVQIGGKIRFDDDGPRLLAGKPTATIVDEDDLDNADPEAGNFGVFDVIEGSAGTSPDSDTDTTDYSGIPFFGGILNTLLNGSTFANGALDGTVNFGADGPGKFFLKSNAVDSLEDQDLKSKGDPISYTSITVSLGGFEGSLVIGYVSNIPDNLIDALVGLLETVVNGGSPTPDQIDELTASAGELPQNPEFRLVLALGTTHDEEGNYQFRLFDQLDHAPADKEGTPAINEDEQIVIDFSELFGARDYDGDTVDLPANTFTIEVKDDQPENLEVRLGNRLIHDETAGDQSGRADADAPADGTREDDNSPAQAAFAALENTGGPLGGLVALGYAQQRNAVSISVETGADEPGGIDLALTRADGGDFAGEATNLRDTATGNRIFLYTGESGAVFGRVGHGAGVGTAVAEGDIAFALVLDDAGKLSLAQYRAILHGDETGNEDETSNDDSRALRAPGGGDILFVTAKVTDFDGDTIVSQSAKGLNIVFDDDGPASTRIVQSKGVYEDELNDVGTQASIPDDENGDGSSHDENYTGNLAALVNFGADGKGGYDIEKTNLSPELLLLTSGGVALTYTIGVDNTLVATAGLITIFEFQVDRITGQYSFRLKGPLDHAPNSDAIVLDMSSAVTARDGDGDLLPLSGQINITVNDDAPVIGATNSIINGQFINGFISNNSAWGQGSGTADDTIPGWDIEPSTVQPMDGNERLERIGLNHRGVTSPSGSQIVDLEEFPGNIQIAQSIVLEPGAVYQLSFEVGRANDPAFANSALLEVLWNGVPVSGSPFTANPGPMQTLLITVVGDGDGTNELTFREIGAAGDHTGTHIANVALVPIVDEDALPNGIEGGPGDVPGAGANAAGSLNIKWGADNKDVADASSVQDGSAANSTATNTSALVGRAVYFTGTVSASAGDSLLSPLESDGQTVKFQELENGTRMVGYTGTFNVADPSNWVFDVSLSDDGAGSYEFTLLKPLDHPDETQEDDILLTFGFSARDYDGDATGSYFRVIVDDDSPQSAPLADPAPTTIEEPGGGAGFGRDGNVLTDIGGSNDYGQSVTIQPDGKIVVAGYGRNGSTDDFALVRYNADGTLDASFGGGDGKLFTDIGGLTDRGQGVTIQPDGKILVAGFGHNGSTFDFALARYNSDGSLDSSFDGDGKLLTDIGPTDQGYGVAVQADGKILVAGYSYNGSSFDFALVRYNTDGTPDAGFGSGGKVLTDIGSNSDGGYSVTVQPDGKIVVAGYGYNGSTQDFALIRYNTDGSLDASFGSGGKVLTDIGGGPEFGRSVTVQPDGKILVSGEGYGSSIDVALVRYNADGSLDTGFGSGGTVLTDIGGDYDGGLSVTVQPDGKIVVAGYSWNGSTYDFSLVRYNANGSLDTGFGGGDGKVLTDIGGAHDLGLSVALQPDGKIVVAGYSWNGSNYDFAVVRYNTDGSLDVAGSDSGPTTASIDLEALVAFGADGRHATDAFEFLSVGNAAFGVAAEGGAPILLTNVNGVLIGHTAGNVNDPVFKLEIVNGDAQLTLYKGLSGDPAMLDFSSYIRAIDGDGDAIQLDAGKVVFSVDAVNDAPVIGGQTAGSISETGDIANIDEAGLTGGLEPRLALNGTITTALTGLLTTPGTVPAALATIAAQLGGNAAQAIAVIWDYLDDIYTSAGPNQGNVNEAFVRLGVEYAKYLLAGGSPFTDVIAKFAPDNNNDGYPQRLQSLHDNLLGNLNAVPLDWRFGSNNAALHAELTALIRNIDPSIDFTTRPIYSGSESGSDSDPAPAEDWDYANGLVPMATGQLTVTDPDQVGGHTWNDGVYDGTYGTFTLDANGKWTYTLDNTRPATQALAKDAVVADSFTVTVTDAFSATDSQLVTVTITGANDAPTITAPNGGNTANVSVLEGTTAVTDVDATDPEGTTLTYSILSTAGTDFSKFTINASTGVLSFIAAPDYELLDDVGGTPNDRTYVVTVQVTDGSLTDTQTINVTVTNDPDDPVANDNIVIVNAVANDGSTLIIPEWALLWNDSDPQGDPLDITSVSQPSDLASVDLANNLGSVTVINNSQGGGSDDEEDWGNFRYTMTAGAQTDPATVTIEIDNDSTLDRDYGSGNGGADIFIDTLSGGHVINAGGGNDVLIGNDGNDTLNGELDNDLLVGGSGEDTLLGGDGNDDLFGGADNDKLYGDQGNDRLFGEGGNDILQGLSGNDFLSGGDGDDFLHGGGTVGDDVLVGGSGFNTLTGGLGADRFVIDTIDIADLIADYSGVEGDKVDLTALFNTAPGGGNVTDFVNYNATTGALSVDADGAGGPATFQTVATLGTSTHPTAASITIIFDDGTNTFETTANNI